MRTCSDGASSADAGASTTWPVRGGTPVEAPPLPSDTSASPCPCPVNMLRRSSDRSGISDPVGFGPGIALQDLTVTLVVRPKGQDLQPVWARFKGPGHGWGHADSVQGAQLRHLPIQDHPATSANDDIDLLGLVVAVGQSPLPGLYPVVGQPGTLGGQLAAGEARLLNRVKAESRGHILYVPEVPDRKAHMRMLWVRPVPARRIGKSGPPGLDRTDPVG